LPRKVSYHRLMMECKYFYLKFIIELDLTASSTVTHHPSHPPSSNGEWSKMIC